MSAEQPFERTVIHVDMDSFYVSVERLLDPSLIGRPVVVGGSPDGRGVVASASYEARKFGVRSAMPMAKAVALCPALVIVSNGYSRYSEYSRQIRGILESFTPLVQMASQDEAYLDVSGTERLWGPPLAMAHLIRQKIFDETRLPCSLGIGKNKLVAKVASALCKPRGLLFIPHASAEAFLAPLPARRIPGIGPKTMERLEEFGIRRVGDIVKLGRDRLERLFGDNGVELYERALGNASSTIELNEPAKSISAEETFAKDTVDREFLHSILSNLSEKVASRMRKEGCRAATLSLKYRYQGFETHTAAETLPVPTDDEVEILETMRRLLETKADPRRPIRLLGVCGANLCFDSLQADLFAEATSERRSRIHEAIDRIREKHGYASLHRASSGGRHEEKNDRQWG